jgi:putative DNA primase/helicase
MNNEPETNGQNSAPINQPAPAAPLALGDTNVPSRPAPSIPPLSRQTAAELEAYLESILALPPVEPWPHGVNGADLLEEIRLKITGHVVLPRWAPETMALWVPHTFAFQYRDITTYLGIESPEHRCGKSTLITILSELTQRAIVASNVTAPSFFRVIAQILPTLFIDEADTFLTGNDELRGILNSSYFKKTAFVLRAVNLPSQNSAPSANAAASSVNAAPSYNPGILRFSCWCPKLIARIGALPTTLADRCIVFRLHRKTAEEPCERLRKFNSGDIKRKCLRFALDHADQIAASQPDIPRELNDRAADVWEPLFVIADLAGGPWPQLARDAAIGVAATSTDSNPIAVLLFDVVMQFLFAKTDRLFSSQLVECLNAYPGRPWKDLLRGKPIDDRWLARQLNPYGIRPRNLRINGAQAKGYCQEDMMETVRRYVPKSEARALLDELEPASEEAPVTEPANGQSPNSQ